MQTTTLEFPHNARTTYTAVKRLFDKSTKFGSVKCNDDLFIVEARRGLWSQESMCLNDLYLKEDRVR